MYNPNKGGDDELLSWGEDGGDGEELGGLIAF